MRMSDCEKAIVKKETTCLNPFPGPLSASGSCHNPVVKQNTNQSLEVTLRTDTEVLVISISNQQ